LKLLLQLIDIDTITYNQLFINVKDTIFESKSQQN